MGSACFKTTPTISKASMEIPSSVYVPLESLTQSTVRSIISVATRLRSPNFDYSERTLLIFLLVINEKLKEIENNILKDGTETDEQSIQRVTQIRQWLVDRNNQPLNWDELRQKYDQIAGKNCDQMAAYYGSKDSEPYFELKLKTRFEGVQRSRIYMDKFRKNGFEPKELKLYWNAEQLENLCPKQGESSNIESPHDPSDDDAIENLRVNPVSERNHSGTIDYIHSGIEKAVFDVPETAQIIVLNFANEQSPGGGYLRNARAQEEVILYNSDGYRALLDLKYKRMGGGYAIPEFGLAYVRNIRFFDSQDENKHRITDMLVSACYCLSGRELYNNPENADQWEKNNLAKFRAFMAAAVANTQGNGSNTYLLLGPIGTGAFGNDVKKIGDIFRQVLEMKMMNSKGPIRYAFEHIWFVSTEACKNEDFQKIIDGNKSNDNQENIEEEKSNNNQENIEEEKSNNNQENIEEEKSNNNQENIEEEKSNNNQENIEEEKSGNNQENIEGEKSDNIQEN